MRRHKLDNHVNTGHFKGKRKKARPREKYLSEENKWPGKKKSI